MPHPVPRRIALASVALAALALTCATPSEDTDRDAHVAEAHAASGSPPATSDPLPSWNEGRAKSEIERFVARVTTPGSDFVPEAERVAVFDNDGTLWSEKPIYVELAFALDRIEALAPEHPEWTTEEPFASVLAGDPKKALGGGARAVAAIVGASHAGMTTDAFDTTVSRWFAAARHPMYRRPYTACVYQPMLELLAYLRESGIETFVVSGGEVDFVRAFAVQTYGIPPERIIGSTSALRYEIRDGAPALVREPKIDFLDDGPGKPVAIERHVGRRPIAAFGNSDGDREMLEWTAAGPGARLALLVHHTDAEREVAYDRKSAVGKLDRALDEAGERGWIVVSVKDDWKRIFPGDAR